MDSDIPNDIYALNKKTPDEAGGALAEFFGIHLKFKLLMYIYYCCRDA